MVSIWVSAESEHFIWFSCDIFRITTANIEACQVRLPSQIFWIWEMFYSFALVPALPTSMSESLNNSLPKVASPAPPSGTGIPKFSVQLAQPQHSPLSGTLGIRWKHGKTRGKLATESKKWPWMTNIYHLNLPINLFIVLTGKIDCYLGHDVLAAILCPQLLALTLWL